MAAAAETLSSFPFDRDLLALHASHPERYPYLLESVTGGGTQARYDILFAASDERLTLGNDGVLAGPGSDAGSFLRALDSWWRSAGTGAEIETCAPFRGGWFVFLGYELAGEIEPRLQLPHADEDFPVAFATRCPAALIRDRISGTVQVVAEPDCGALAEQLRSDVDEAIALPDNETLRWAALVEDAPEKYLDAVRRIQEYIRAGDVFQVNIARAWHAQFDGPGDAVSLYRALRRSNPAPFAGIARHDGAYVISSSPERLVQVQGDVVQTRPIAGTHARLGDGCDDMASDALLQHPKERAEHIMLIDLERNDLGRVCEPGSIEVNELMTLESHAHVHHIVSNVRGRLRHDATPGAIIRAVFPGGTITGCPKIRCMEIIAELEQVGRGAYTGAMGYLNRNGDMDFNILIRTLTQYQNQVCLRAGAGIVADSIPEQELNETRAKAKGLLLALDALPG